MANVMTIEERSSYTLDSIAARIREANIAGDKESYKRLKDEFRELPGGHAGLVEHPQPYAAALRERLAAG